MLKDRLNWDEYACLLALAASTRSEDPFTQTGAALLDSDGAVLGTGTNGLKRGMTVPDWMFLEERRSEKSKLIIHAEKNLWRNKKDGKGHLLGLTITPCRSCAELIASSDVKKVVYFKPYERGTDDYKEIFDFYNIEYTELSQHSKTRIKRVLMEKILII